VNSEQECIGNPSFILYPSWKTICSSVYKTKESLVDYLSQLTLTISAVRVSTTERDHLVVSYTKNKYQFARIDFLQFLLSLESWEGFNIFVSQF